MDPPRMSSLLMGPLHTDSPYMGPLHMDPTRTDPSRGPTPHVRRPHGPILHGTTLHGTTPLHRKPPCMDPLKVVYASFEPLRMHQNRTYAPLMHTLRMDPTRSDTLRMDPLSMDPLRMDPTRMYQLRTDPLCSACTYPRPAQAGHTTKTVNDTTNQARGLQTMADIAPLGTETGHKTRTITSGTSNRTDGPQTPAGIASPGTGPMARPRHTQAEHKTGQQYNLRSGGALHPTTV
jgi:hypothetical protein